jgi:hypothetical protein
MKKTAVEWLFMMLNNPNRNQEFAYKLFDKAKEIEKQQIMDAFGSGEDNIDANGDLIIKNGAEQYYKEIYE